MEVIRTERGGEVTYHGPGQLTVYPVLDLRGYRRDVHWYMRALEEAALLALEYSGVRGATRESDVTGVWISGEKVAAVGVRCRRWVTTHGLAVNVEGISLSNFDGIVPCGLVGRDVTCVDRHVGRRRTPEEGGEEDGAVTVEQFAVHMCRALEEVFQIELVKG